MTSATPIALAVEQLSKVYNEHLPEIMVRAVDAIDFQVREGESVAIIGPSGCGKSSLLHILGCLDRPTYGDYILSGNRVSELDEDDLAEIRHRYIGFVFQSFNLLPRMTAVENVALPLLYAGRRHAKEQALEALERVGLADRGHHLPNELSGGQKQRVAIARALVTRPALLLGDEPTGALDTKTGAAVLDLLSELNDEGTTLVMVTHDLSVAARLKRGIRMRDGKIVHDAPASEVVEAAMHEAALEVAC